MSNTIKVTVKLFAQYRDNRFKVEIKEYNSNVTPRDIIEDLGIHEDKLPLGVLMVNGRHQKEDFQLKEGDTISLFPKVGGG